MTEQDDLLISEFKARRNEDAFAALVRHHVDLVFATAMRQVGDFGAAEEITQNVFVALARNSGKLGSSPTIAGWLYRTTLHKSREWLRSELRRRQREQAAFQLEAVRQEGDSAWSPLVPLLDEAMMELRESDRLAVALHFMEGRTFRELGLALGVGEEAARKRVARCLDQMTRFFRRRGFAVPALAVGAPLFALSSHAAPPGLAASASTAGLAAAPTAASASSATLMKGALKCMAWTKAKTAIAAGAGLFLAAGLITGVPWARRVPQSHFQGSVDERFKSFLSEPPPFVDIFYSESKIRGGKTADTYFYRLIRDSDAVVCLSTRTNLAALHLLDCWECYDEFRGRNKNIYWYKHWNDYGAWTNTSARIHQNSVAFCADSVEGINVPEILNMGCQAAPLGHKIWTGDTFTAMNGERKIKVTESFHADAFGRAESVLLTVWSTKQTPFARLGSQSIAYSYEKNSEWPFIPSKFTLFAFVPNKRGAPQKDESKEYSILYFSAKPSADQRFSTAVPPPEAFQGLVRMETISNEFRVWAPASGSKWSPQHDFERIERDPLAKYPPPWR